MLNKYFDKIYVINLDRRTDRLESITAEFERIGSTFTRISAIDGNTLDVEPDNKNGTLRWNKAAYALALTTIQILEDAIANNYENILIFEDDVKFNPLIDLIGDEFLCSMPKKYDLVFLGLAHTGYPTLYNPYWDKVKSCFGCHAYGVGKHMLLSYKKLLEKLDRPIDHYTNIIIGSRLNSFSTRKKLAYQESGISDIEGGYYNVSFTK